MEDNFKLSKRSLASRVLKAGIKAFLVYIAYFLFALLTQPIFEYVGKYTQIVDAFFIAMVFFVFLTEFFSGTILKYMFDFSRNLFVIFYFISALNGGIVDISMAGISVTVNIQFFLLMLVLISVVGMGRILLSAVNFLSEEAEKENYR